MTIPNSVIIVILVVAWLIMLVPIYARRHERVHENDEGANFRMVKSSGRKRMKRGMGSYRRAESGDEQFAEDLEADDYAADDYVADDYVAESDDFVDEAVEDADEYVEVEVVETEIVTVEYDEEPVRASNRDYADDEMNSADEDYESAAEDRRVSAEREEFEEPAYRAAPERIAPSPHRVGRGGYDAEAAEIARAYRYSQRQRVALILLVATVAFAGAAYFAMPALWAGAGVSGALLALYLWYLRRQVTIEEDIRQRRLARLQRAREIRPEHAYVPRAAYEPAAAQVPESAVNRRGRVVLDLDDDDPGFDDLEYYAPVEYRRASGQ